MNTTFFPHVGPSASIEDQIAECERDIAERRKVYALACTKGTMRVHKAEQRLAAMISTVETLKEVKRKRDGAKVAG